MGQKIRNIWLVMGVKPTFEDKWGLKLSKGKEHMS